MLMKSCVWLLVFRSLIRIFEINLQDTTACCEKKSSELDISRSLIRIFEINLQDTSARCEKKSSELDIYSLAYSYLCD